MLGGTGGGLASSAWAGGGCDTVNAAASATGKSAAGLLMLSSLFAATRDSVNYLGVTSVPVNVNVPSAVPPPSRGSPWSGKLVSVMVPATFVRAELNVKV